ncbi:FAD-dependent oxidoreductase [Pseudonocardiaceae bacterium YIM PH 21723]|nr:FAD-dependent oxidoreductase [Pseudonocardiaceae bacterium YIM PH 21723]
MGRYEVVVAGAGPVGLCTAMFLAARGIRVLVVDRRDPLGGPPRAVSSLRTLEILRNAGLDVDRAGWHGPTPLRNLVKESGIGPVLETASAPARYLDRLRDCSPIDHRHLLNQLDIQRLALERLPGMVRFPAVLTGFEQDATGVRITLDGAEQVTADYLIAADGAHSPIRERLGIGMPGRFVASRLNAMFFRAELGTAFPEWTERMCFIRNEKVYGTLVSMGSDGDHWSSQIIDYPGKPSELTRFSERQALDHLHAIIGSDSYEIEMLASNPWEAAIGMAERFREDRVFLVGDAAHVQSGAGGLGMNTGIQDGHNLAWKLAAVLRGQAGEALLDSYQVERQQAADRSLALSHGMHRRLTTHRDDWDTLWSQIAEDYLRGMMFYDYASAAIIPDDGADPGLFGDWAMPGRRLPHRKLTDESSTVDLVGEEWTLLAGPDDRWRTSGLRAVRMGAEFTELSGTGPRGALLVRPDGVVAWRAHEPTDLRPVLRRLLSR